MPSFPYKLHDIGEGIHEGEIVNWLIQAGDRVTEDQIIAEIQNDKAVVEIPSPINGKVLEIKAAVGTTVVVGDTLVVFDAEGIAEETSAVHASGAATTATTAETSAMTSAPGTVGGAGNKASVQEAVAGNIGDNKSASRERDTVAGDASTSSSKPLATPSVRKLAREKGIRLAEVTGTGKNGTITREDVLHFASGPVPAPQPTGDLAVDDEIGCEPVEQPVVRQTAIIGGLNAEERIPLKGIRKVIADAMVKSMYTAPQVTVMDEADVTRLVEFRDKAKTLAEKKGVKLTYMPFFIKAIVAACRRFPIMNASLDERTNEIVIKKHYDVGVAMDTEQGLLVPVIKDADRKNMWSIAEELSDLTTRGRQGKLSIHELKGSTITITNIGSAGGMFFTPVLNYPESAIMGTGKIANKPVVRGCDIVAAPVMSLSLTFDHRIIDGATAQNFMNEVKTMLEQPDLLLMEI